MKILYQWSNPDTLYAGRTIAHGYKNAFTDMRHTFRFLTPDSNQKKLLLDYKPDIFITSFNRLCIHFLNRELLRLAKKRGTKVFVNIPFWNSPLSRVRINEEESLKNSRLFLDLISHDNYGDVYFNSTEQDDPRMKGLHKKTGHAHKTLLLAADKTVLYPDYDDTYASDISYIGTNLPEKRDFFKRTILPLKKKCVVKIYGADWSLFDRGLGIIMRVGQYGNIPILKSIIKPKLQIEDERKIYASSVISINIHEHYQQKYGDLNERTFKIPISGGFEIMDNVAGIQSLFTPDKEIVIATSRSDWHDKIDFYLKNPEKRVPIIEAGRKKVAEFHTYHNRVKTMIDWYKQL